MCVSDLLRLFAPPTCLVLTELPSKEMSGSGENSQAPDKENMSQRKSREHSLQMGTGILSRSLHIYNFLSVTVA